MKPFDSKNTVRCPMHGLQLPTVSCSLCINGLLKQNEKLQGDNAALIAHLTPMPEILRKLDTELTELKKEIHQVLCVDGLHGPLPEGTHHPKCKLGVPNTVEIECPK